MMDVYPLGLELISRRRLRRLPPHALWNRSIAMRVGVCAQYKTGVDSFADELLQWNCANPFCTKMFSSKRGQEKHYESTACGLHGLTATRPLERRLSVPEKSNHISEGDESFGLLGSDTELLVIEPNETAIISGPLKRKEYGGQMGSGLLDSEDEVSSSYDESEMIDEDKDIPADKPLILRDVDEDSNSSGSPTNDIFIEEYIGAAQIICHGPNYYEQLLKTNELSQTRVIANGPPFSSRAELELVKILDTLSKSKIDDFLRSEYVSLRSSKYVACYSMLTVIVS